jgi:hypothetical protein
MAMTKVGAVSVDDDCVVEHDEYGPCEPADVVPKLEEPEVDEPLAGLREVGSRAVDGHELTPRTLVDEVAPASFARGVLWWHREASAVHEAQEAIVGGARRQQRF